MPALRKNYDSAVTMYNYGMSVQDVAEIYGITRQAMHVILKRRCVNFRSNKKFGDDNHFYRGGYAKDDRVHSIVTKAIQRGKLICQPCEVCGVYENIEAHHDDYNKPLAVRWLCKQHHYEWHKKHKPIRRTIDLPPMPREQIASLGGNASSTKFKRKP